MPYTAAVKTSTMIYRETASSTESSICAVVGGRLVQSLVRTSSAVYLCKGSSQYSVFPREQLGIGRWVLLLLWSCRVVLLWCSLLVVVERDELQRKDCRLPPSKWYIILLLVYICMIYKSTSKYLFLSTALVYAMENNVHRTHHWSSRLQSSSSSSSLEPQIQQQQYIRQLLYCSAVIYHRIAAASLYSPHISSGSTQRSSSAFRGVSSSIPSWAHAPQGKLAGGYSTLIDWLTFRPSAAAAAAPYLSYYHTPHVNWLDRDFLGKSLFSTSNSKNKASKRFWFFCCIWNAGSHTDTTDSRQSYLSWSSYKYRPII